MDDLLLSHVDTLTRVGSTRNNFLPNIRSAANSPQNIGGHGAAADSTPSKPSNFMPILKEKQRLQKSPSGLDGSATTRNTHKVFNEFSSGGGYIDMANKMLDKELAQNKARRFKKNQKMDQLAQRIKMA